jgi:hypothetical protein
MDLQSKVARVGRILEEYQTLPPEILKEGGRILRTGIGSE